MTRAEAAPRPVGASLAPRQILAWAGVLLFFTGLDNYAFTAWAWPKPLHWVLLFIAATAALLAAEARRPLPLLGAPVFAWAYCFALLTTTWAIWMRSSAATLELLSDRYRAIAFLLAFAVLFGDTRARQAGLHAVTAATVFASVANIAELLGLVDFSRVDAPIAMRTLGRAAGLYVNPNGAGLVIAVGLAMAVPALRERWRLPLFLLGALGIAASFSRGALFCLGFLSLWLVWRRVLSPWRLIVALAVAAAVGLLAMTYLDAHDLPLPDLQARLNDDSGRIAVLVRAWELFLRAPMLGNGLGSTVDWDVPISSHNTYLNLAADHGFLGLLVLPALGYALVAGNREGASLAVVLLLTGFFIHDLLSARPFLIAVALFAPPARARDASAPGRQRLETAPLDFQRRVGPGEET